MTLATNFTVPRRLRIEPFGKRPGWGEDDPIWWNRLARDGWSLVSYPTGTTNQLGAKVWVEFNPAITWRKHHPKSPKRYSLEMSITGIKERDGPWYMTEHSVVKDAGYLDKIGRSDWADWDRSGDLLFAMDGCIYRTPYQDGTLARLEDAKKIADFSKLKFEARIAPEKALRWR
jgi:hypothetical protein